MAAWLLEVLSHLNQGACWRLPDVCVSVLVDSSFLPCVNFRPFLVLLVFVGI